MADDTRTDGLEDDLREEGADPGVPVDVSRFVDWYEAYADNSTKSRELIERDRKFYHHKQWTTEEKSALEMRNQPEVTFNRIQPKINFIRGFETRTRIDPDAKPRTPAHQDAANAATDALRYTADVAQFDRIRSVVTEELLVPGTGGSILGVQTHTKPDGTVDHEITLTPVRDDRFFYDLHSREPDFSDAKYYGVVVWWHVEDAKKHPPYMDKADILDEALAEGSGAGADGEAWAPHEDKPSVWVDPTSKRVRIVEVYYQDPVEDPQTREVHPEWFVCHYTRAGALVEPTMLPWRDDHGRTFSPLDATSSFVDDENKRYGVVRGMISAQEEINKRRSRALWEATMRTFAYEEGAMEDPDEFSTEIAKADGKAKVNDDALVDGRIKFLDQPGANPSQLALYQDAKQEIDATGPSLPVVGGDQSVMSGRAILAKQNIGSMELETVFDNLRNWQQSVFKKMWWMIRMLWTEEKWLRVRDSTRKEGYRFVPVNRDMLRGERVMELVQQEEVPFDSAIQQVGIPMFQIQQLVAQAQQTAQMQMQPMLQQAQQAGQQIPPQLIQQQMKQMVQALVVQSPAMQEPFRMNDIAQLEVDIVIDVAPDTTIAAQEEYSHLLEMTAQGVWTAAPPPVMKALVENSNLRGKQAIIAALDRPPDPQQVQFQQQQMQLQLQTQAAVLQRLQAEIGKIQAQTVHEQAGAQHDAARAQIGVAAEAERDQAQAAKLVSEAGQNTV